MSAFSSVSLKSFLPNDAAPVIGGLGSFLNYKTD